MNQNDQNKSTQESIQAFLDDIITLQTDIQRLKDLERLSNENNHDKEIKAKQDKLNELLQFVQLSESLPVKIEETKKEESDKVVKRPDTNVTISITEQLNEREIIENNTLKILNQLKTFGLRTMYLVLIFSIGLVIGGVYVGKGLLIGIGVFLLFLTIGCAVLVAGGSLKLAYKGFSFEVKNELNNQNKK